MHRLFRGPAPITFAARATAVALVVGLGLLWPARISSGQPAGDTGVPDVFKETPWAARLWEWTQAVDQHEPGDNDEAVLLLAGWDADTVSTVVDDYLDLHEQVAGSARSAIARALGKRRGRALTRGQIQLIPALAIATGEPTNRFLRRAAMLHGDVAILATVDRSRSTAPAEIVTSLDGAVVGREGHSRHWFAGTTLINAISPSPAHDPFAALWFRGTLSSMLEQRNLATATIHVKSGLSAVDGDGGLQYEAGCYYQAGSAPIIEAVKRILEALIKKTRNAAATPEVPEARECYERADRHFQQAQILGGAPPDLAIRHALILLDLKQAERAWQRLADAVSTDDRVLTYFTHLVRGRAAHETGRNDAAIQEYKRAATLFPDARSPWFGLAVAFRTRGERDEAWRMTTMATKPPVADQREADPWWNLATWRTVPSTQILNGARAIVRAEIDP